MQGLKTKERAIKILKFTGVQQPEIDKVLARDGDNLDWIFNNITPHQKMVFDHDYVAACNIILGINVVRTR